MRIHNINAKVKIGDYDNIIQDSKKFNNSNLTIIFWELCNIVDGLQYKIELFDDKKFNELISKIKLEIDLVFENLKDSSLVIFNYFSSLLFNTSNIRKSKLDLLSKQLNQYLEKKVSRNIKLINLDKLISRIGLNNSIDFRFYYSSKALYKVDFFKLYVYHIKPIILSANGRSKKILIFDCDNTLWKGILGEDGYDKIEMNPNTKNGYIFNEIQNIALFLNKINLLGLCSKNNSSDVRK